MIHTLFSKYPSGFLVTKEKGAPTAKVVVTTPQHRLQSRHLTRKKRKRIGKYSGGF